jgi:hypothetical protein
MEQLELFNINEEIWKPIKGLENRLKISSKGRVKSLTKNNKEGVILKPNPNSEGYLRLATSINGQRFVRFIHRLVAQAFIDNPENKPFVNHINGIKDDNKVENLEWCTKSENMKHAYRTKLMVAKKGKKDLQVKELLVFDLEEKYIKTLYRPKEWREFGLDPSCVMKCLRGVRKSHLGYTFKTTSL